MRKNQTPMQKKGKTGRRMTAIKKSLPLTMMALPGIVLMLIFKYLPLGGIILAFKRFNVRKGIWGSDFVGWDNFKFLFQSSDAWVITRNTLLYNLAFIALDVVLAVTFAIILNELLHKKRAKLFQSIYIAPYFLSWVAVSFVAYAFLSVDNGLLNRLLISFGKDPVSWYAESKW